MKKKIFIGLAMSLFAVATVFNMNMLNENGGGDISLEAISVMAQAQSEHDPCPGDIEWQWRCLFTEGRCAIAQGCLRVCYGGC